MKVLKYILLVVVAIIALVLIVAAIAPSEYAVVREIKIDKPKSEVFDYIKYLKNQDNYSVWANMDPNMKKTFTGTDGEVGFTSAWDSDNEDVGKGEQEIKKIVEGERMEFELRFYEPFESTDFAYMTTDVVDSTTTLVKWGFDGKMPYPMNLMLLTMDFDKMLGDDLEQGLQKLKVVLEE